MSKPSIQEILPALCKIKLGHVHFFKPSVGHELTVSLTKSDSNSPSLELMASRDLRVRLDDYFEAHSGLTCAAIPFHRHPLRDAGASEGTPKEKLYTLMSGKCSVIIIVDGKPVCYEMNSPGNKVAVKAGAWHAMVFHADTFVTVTLSSVDSISPEWELFAASIGN